MQARGDAPGADQQRERPQHQARPAVGEERDGGKNARDNRVVGGEGVVYRMRDKWFETLLGKGLIVGVKKPRQPRERVAKRESDCHYPKQLPAPAPHSPPHDKRAAERDDIHKIFGGKDNKKSHVFLFYPDVGVVAGSRPSGNVRDHNV